MKETTTLNPEHCASARSLNLPISTKHSIEISSYIRYKTTSFAKKFLEDVTQLRKPVPFKRFNRDLGHKSGMSAGRFPQKAAQQFLQLVRSAEANANSKGLDTSNLKISKLVANKASIPTTGGRHRSGTKRTHLEIVVVEGKKKEKKATPQKKKLESATKPVSEVKEETKPVSKVEEPKVESQEKVQEPETKEESNETKKEENTENTERLKETPKEDTQSQEKKQGETSQ